MYTISEEEWDKVQDIVNKLKKEFSRLELRLTFKQPKQVTSLDIKI